MIDKEVILAFINGPGSSLAFMWLALLVFIFGIYAVRKFNKSEDIKRQAKEDAQRGALQNIEQTLRVMRSEQNEFKKQIGIPVSHTETVENY